MGGHEKLSSPGQSTLFCAFHHAKTFEAWPGAIVPADVEPAAGAESFAWLHNEKATLRRSSTTVE